MTTGKSETTKESEVSEAQTTSGPARPRYGAYNEHGGDWAEIAVKVTAADFNGQSWDGHPFSAIPDWLALAIKRGDVTPHTRGSTDYAQWDVKTERGVINATPGDWIIRRERGDLSVVDEQDAFILLNLRPPVRDDNVEVASHGG